MTHIFELIYTEEREGLGQKDDDPIRKNPQLWTKDGKKIAQYDSITKEMYFNPSNL